MSLRSLGSVLGLGILFAVPACLTPTEPVPEDQVLASPDAGSPSDAGSSGLSGAGPSCTIDGQVVAARSYKPGDTSLCCNGDQNASGWTASLISAGTFPVISAAPYAMVAADFNLDGLGDLAVSTGSNDNTLTFFFNQGAAGFTTQALTPSVFPGALRVGDFNGDGRPDVAIGGYSGVGVLLNLDGGFSEVDATSSGQVDYVAAADVNGDGHLDLIGAGGGGFVSVFLGDGLGGLGTESTYPTGGMSSFFVVAGIFGPDRLPDLAVNDVGGGAAWLINDGTGTFSQWIAIPDVQSSWALSTGDFAGPGITSLVVGSDGETKVFSNTADGGSSAPATYASVYAGGYAVGDLNGDGHDDLIAIGDMKIEILINRGDGTGTFLPGAEFVGSTSEGLQALAVGDFNGDGALDVAVVASNASSGTIWLNGCP